MKRNINHRWTRIHTDKKLLMKSVFICVHLWFFQFFIFMNIARADDINTTHSFCQLLPNYKEAPGVEYQPGVCAISIPLKFLLRPIWLGNLASTCRRARN